MLRKREVAGSEKETGWWKRSWKLAPAGSAAGGRGSSSRNAGSLQKLEKAGK